MYDFLIFIGCAKARRPPLASMLGVGYDSLHTHRLTIGGQHFFAREGVINAAQFGRHGSDKSPTPYFTFLSERC
jgi:hypothetical protein